MVLINGNYIGENYKMDFSDTFFIGSNFFSVSYLKS